MIQEWFRKCVICRRKNKLLKYVHQFGIYGDVSPLKYAYHPSCINEVCCEPEKFTHNQVDWALEITNLIVKHKEEEERFMEKCKSLRKRCV